MTWAVNSRSSFVEREELYIGRWLDDSRSHDSAVGGVCRRDRSLALLTRYAPRPLRDHRCGSTNDPPLGCEHETKSHAISSSM